MAKKKQEQTNADGESTMGYFRRIFKENPKLLKSKSNADIFDRWLTDHPGEKEVPKKVKQSLSNTKSVLRSKSRRRKPKAEDLDQQHQELQPSLKTQNRKLETLELLIDDCLIL